MYKDVFSSFDFSIFSLFGNFFYIFFFGFFLMMVVYFMSMLIKFNFSNTFLPVSIEAQGLMKNFSSGMLVFLFFFIFLMNTLGNFPYIYSVSSMMMITLCLGLPFFLAFFFSSMMNNFKMFLSTFIPSGAPLGLSPFLFLVELISFFVRPLTLSLRLAANITSGHVILGLMSSGLSLLILSNIKFYFLFSFVLWFFCIFELFVGFLQSFIFYLLLSLYLSEHV